MKLPDKRNDEGNAIWLQKDSHFRGSPIFTGATGRIIEL